MNRIPNLIPRRRAAEFLWNETEGRVFSVYFEKKDKTMRRMVCRRGVSRYVTGRGLKYDPKPKRLLPVFDMELARAMRTLGDPTAYRMVNLDKLVSFNIGGETFVLTAA